MTATAVVLGLIDTVPEEFLEGRDVGSVCHVVAVEVAIAGVQVGMEFADVRQVDLAIFVEVGELRVDKGIVERLLDAPIAVAA